MPHQLLFVRNDHEQKTDYGWPYIRIIKNINNIKKHNYLISFKFWTYLIQKETNLSSNVVPLELDYLVAKGTTTFDMQIFCFSIKFGLNLSKNEHNFNPKAAPTESDFSVANEQKHSCYANI